MERIWREGSALVRQRRPCTRRYDALVCTIPIQELAAALEGTPPEILRRRQCAALQLARHRLGWPGRRARPDYTAIYVPDPEVRFHRLSFPAAFSPHNAPPGQSIIQAEITTNPGDGTHEMSDEELLADVINDLQDMDLVRRSEVCYSRVLRTKYGYVVQNDDCRRYLKRAKAYFEQIGIPLCGRVAEFEYINMDVCIERARKVGRSFEPRAPLSRSPMEMSRMKPSRRPYFEIANPEIPTNHGGASARPARAGCRMRLGRAWSGIATLAWPSRGWRGSFGGFHRKSQDASRRRLRRRRHPAGRLSIHGRQQFDVILFSDMLEHLADPLDVLMRHYQLLAPGGQMLISLPNVAIWNVRLALLLGRFEYGDTGTLDRTHMRFFTRRSFRRFLGDARPRRQPQARHARNTPAVRAVDQADVRQGIGNSPARRFFVHHGLGALPVVSAAGSIPWSAGSAALARACWRSSS